MSESEATSFHPSENQLKALKAWQDEDYTCTVGEGMSVAGFKRETWYAWMGVPEFAKWWEAEAQKHFMRLLPKIYGAMCRAATGKGGLDLSRGAADRKTILERFDRGFVPRSSKEITGDLTATLDLSMMTDETLQALAHAVRDVDAQRVLDRARELEAPKSA